MVSLAELSSSDFVKMIFIGDSGTGKTGALTSLVAAGYKLRILDLDNGTQILKQFVMHECPDKIGNVDVESRRDTYKMTAAGPVVSGVPKAFVEAVKLLNKWTDDTTPSAWGSDTIFVLDTLTTLGKAAMAWAESMNPGVKDPRQWYNTAQQAVEKMLMMLTDPEFRAHVIVISHITYSEAQDGTTKGYTSAVGKALGPHIPKYFNTLVLAESEGSGKSVRRRIKIAPTGVVDLKTPVPFKLTEPLDLGTGLATLFNLIRETKS